MFKKLLHKDSDIYAIVNRTIDSLHTLNIIDDKCILIEFYDNDILLSTYHYYYNKGVSIHSNIDCIYNRNQRLLDNLIVEFEIFERKQKIDRI